MIVSAFYLPCRIPPYAKLDGAREGRTNGLATTPARGIKPHTPFGCPLGGGGSVRYLHRGAVILRALSSRRGTRHTALANCFHPKTIACRRDEERCDLRTLPPSLFLFVGTRHTMDAFLCTPCSYVATSRRSHVRQPCPYAYRIHFALARTHCTRCPAPILCILACYTIVEVYLAWLSLHSVGGRRVGVTSQPSQPPIA